MKGFISHKVLRACFKSAFRRALLEASRRSDDSDGKEFFLGKADQVVELAIVLEIIQDRKELESP